MLRCVFYLPFALVCMFACTSCEKQQAFTTGAATFDLTPEQLKAFEVEGLTNASAAFKLYEYHSYAYFNSNQARLWLERAAKGGHRVAQYNLGVAMMEGGGKPEESRRWLSLAAAQGMTEAKEKLKELGDEKKP